jgi:hypothetical protein
MSVIIGVVEAAEWGASRPSDIRAVCLSAAQCFGRAIDERQVEPIRVEASHGHEPPVPRVALERWETGQVRVFLSAGERAWWQFAYQFAHEFCHVLANFRGPIIRPTAWIEESLCETSALFALRAMSRLWRELPPYPNWVANADRLARYAAALQEDLAWPRQAGPVTFAEWLAAARPGLEDRPYGPEQILQRKVIAARLLPIFEADDGQAWCAVRYLNLWSSLADVRTDTYFDAWRSVAPPQHHPTVTQIENTILGERVPEE